MEEFKKIVEDYEISNLGNVRRKLKNGEYREIKGSILNRGYRYFQIVRDKKRTNYLIHHLVAQAFIGERPNGLIIDHIDRNSLNNTVSNLRYVTQAENMRNTYRYKTEIPADVENRRYHIDKLYRENNKESVLAKNKEYYHNNKEVLLSKQKEKKVEVECNECNTTRIISKGTYNRSIRLGVNVCRACSAKKNLLKANKKRDDCSSLGS